MQPSPSFDHLFAHQEWVRALAVRLCADSSSAEDVVQETWLAAWRAPASAASSRGWLGGVIRHLAWRDQRRIEMRAEREARAARDEAIPGPEQLLARAELQRRVLAAVAKLDDAHRTVVLLRYYENLSSEAIAKRLHCPSSTVRNRLARANELLRAELDREYDTRATWSALFAPALAWKTTTGVAAGVGVMMKAQMAIGAALLACAAIWWWQRSEAGVAPSAPSVLASSEPTAPAIAADVTTERATARDGERQDVAVAPARSVEHVLVWGEIHGAEASKLDGGALNFVDERGTSRAATLGAQSSYSVFGLAPGKLRVSAWYRGFVPFDEELVLPGDQEKVRHDLTLVRSLVIPVKLIERGTGQLFSTRFTSWECGLAVMATREKPVRIEGVFSRTPMNNEVAMYHAASEHSKDELVPAGCSGALEIRTPLPLYASCVLRSVVLESRLLAGNETEIVFELDRAELESKLASYTVRCVDGRTGQPIAGAFVDADTQDGGSGGRATSDTKGVASASKIAPGMRWLSVSAKDMASYAHWVRLEPGEMLDAGTIELFPEARVTGRVLAPDGSGVSAPLIAFAPQHIAIAGDLERHVWYDSASDGSFDVGWLAAGKVRIVAKPADWALSFVDVDTSKGAAENVELRVEKGTDVLLWLERGRWTSADLLLATASGEALTDVTLYPNEPARLKLRPGEYELRRFVGERVVERRMLTVGGDPLSIEISPGE